MSEFTVVGLVGVALLLVLLFTRMAVAYIMALVGFLGYSYLTNFQAGLMLPFAGYLQRILILQPDPHSPVHLHGLYRVFRGHQHPPL